MMRRARNRNNQNAVQIVSEGLPDSEWNSTLDEGEEFICRNCDVPEKPCVENPMYECPEKIMGGTQLESVLERSRLIMNGESPRCASCGKRLSVRQIQREPLSELCPACRGVTGKPRKARN